MQKYIGCRSLEMVMLDLKLNSSHCLKYSYKWQTVCNGKNMRHYQPDDLLCMSTKIFIFVFIFHIPIVF